MRQSSWTLLCGVVFLALSGTSMAQTLTTRWAAEVKPESVHAEYPRPQLVRPRWQNLNGNWQYAIRPRDAAQPGTDQFDGAILVPFAVESSLSGVKKPVGQANHLWYRRPFSVPKDWNGQRILLHFGAVDWDTTVWVNGREMGSHRGGYDPFSFDITEAIRGEGDNEIVIRVWDPTDSGSQPRGKQVNRPHGIWYTAVTGIWQTVWLEPVPKTYIESLKITPNVNSGTVEVTVRAKGSSAESPVRVEVLEEGHAVSSADGQAGKVISVPVTNAKLWAPDSPHLYDLRVSLADKDLAGQDSVTSYFGMRKIEVQRDAAGFPRLLLNGKVLFQCGPLDQGWWPDGLYTAPNDAALKYDIEMTRRFGFNMCRKHVKVEPDRWYYWADKLGLLVWQDMPSVMAAGKKHGIAPGSANDAEFSAEDKAIFRREWQAIIDAVYNHPSIVVLVPFNEGWGQHDTNEVLAWTKQYDPTRLIDGPSGWEDRGFGDMKDMHRYPGPGMFPAEESRVSVLGEFGGLGLPVEGHTWLNRDNWGYRTYTTQEELSRNYEQLIKQLPPLISEGLAAAIYTQTTDVEIEVNGLLTYDRGVTKIPVERLAELHRELYLPPRKRAVLVPTSEKEPQAWRFRLPAPPEGWEKPDFDDSSWTEGQGGFGTVGTPNTTVRTRWDTPQIWLRRTFQLGDVQNKTVYLRVYHDEDAEIYVNGQRIASVKGYVTQYIDIPLDDAARAHLRNGANVFAIHCRQTGGGQFIDAGFDVFEAR